MSRGGAKKLKHKEWVECAWCGKKFLKEYGRSKFCSKKCARANVNYKRQTGFYKRKKIPEQLEERLNWGIDYGKKQMEETLKMVGRIEI